jgi:hypothetical protein
MIVPPMREPSRRIAGVERRGLAGNTRSHRRARVARLVACSATALFVGFHASVAAAITSAVELTQLGHTAWRVQDGVLAAPPYGDSPDE